jgi:hypothetical protein
MKFLWTSGPQQRSNAIKFFAMTFTFVTLVVWAGISFGIESWKIPDITSELLGIFWGGYILNSRGKEWLKNKQGDAPAAE